MARRGGHGEVATSKESSRLDKDMKLISKAIAQVQSTYYYEEGHTNYVAKRFSIKTRLRKALPELSAAGIITGCMPDGGMWFDSNRDSANRIMHYAFEGKFQDITGNAIERWGDNWLICEYINPNLKYITLLAGPGAAESEVLWKHAQDKTILTRGRAKFYLSIDGFTQEQIFEIMNEEMNLGLTFSQIKPYIGKDLNFGNMFIIEETPEELQARLEASQARALVERQFSTFAQNPADPLYKVWHRIPKVSLTEAHDIVLDMMQEGKANSEIATELVQCFLNKV
jgi:hypothetical protein